MTPYQRIAIYQRLDHDRELAEKRLPCSVYTSCAGIRDEGPKCPGCPLKAS
jgi:hypothetical protein